MLQLSIFLTTPLDKAGGLLALTDVYCIFNRARGTELVSPDDLLAAGQLFPQLGASMQLKRFTSGVLVVQSNSHNTEQASLAFLASTLNSRAHLQQYVVKQVLCMSDKRFPPSAGVHKDR